MFTEQMKNAAATRLIRHFSFVPVQGFSGFILKNLAQEQDVIATFCSVRHQGMLQKA
jgi:hypothetical protein